MRSQLFMVAEALGTVPWLLGASGLLLAHGLTERVGDWDLLVPADARGEVADRLAPWLESIIVDRDPPWRSAFIGRLAVDGVPIEVIGGMALRHEEGVYRVEVGLPTDWWEVEGRRIPLAPLEEWYILYLLMGREAKAARIESLLPVRAGARTTLEALLASKQIPGAIRQRIEQVASSL